jgi:mannose-1-phosphate guanylyltransferase
VRLRPYTTCIPKPLVPIGDEMSILEIVLRQLRSMGFESATLAIGHLGQLIRAYVGDGSQWGMRVNFHAEQTPLGTLGPLIDMRDDLPEQFLVMNGDILTDLDYRALMDTHRATGADLTIATYERQVKIDFGVLRVNDDEVLDFTEKPTIDYSVSMGIYGFSRRLLYDYAPGSVMGFDTLILDRLRSGRPPKRFKFSSYWLDIGRPDDYDRAQSEFALRRDQLLHADTPQLRGRIPRARAAARGAPVAVGT